VSELSQVLPGLFEPPPDPKRRGEARKAKRQRKRRRRRRALVTVLLFAIVIGGGFGGAYIGLAPTIRSMMAPKDYTGAGTGRVTVKIPVGASGRTIARVLYTAGVVKTQSAFVDALAKNPKSSSIQPGTYLLHRQMSSASAITMLLDKNSRLQISVTIPEGSRVDTILTTLSKELGLKRSELVKASTSGDIGLPAAAKGHPEGFLFPATYDFEPDTTATQALQAMVEHGKSTYAQLDIPSSKLRVVVTEASIVQAEAGNQKYMGKVATVLDNRLKKHWKLQLDSTVSYAVQRFGVTTTSTERASKSHFNTYRYSGLPIGPIGNPGEDALKAVLNPTPGPWLYFVTVNPSTGETKFATTAAQHLANQREFQAWLRAHPGN
jgi:UPF0755 protein